MDKIIHIDKATICVLEEGVMENVFLGGRIIEAADMWELRKHNLALTNSKPYTVLVMAEELTSFSMEARELAASKEFKGVTIAKALVYEGLGQRIVANFYMKVNKPNIKTKVFSDRKKAIEWLREEYKHALSIPSEQLSE